MGNDETAPLLDRERRPKEEVEICHWCGKLVAPGTDLCVSCQCEYS